jgi:hypothetical protein
MKALGNYYHATANALWRSTFERSQAVGAGAIRPVIIQTLQILTPHPQHFGTSQRIIAGHFLFLFISIYFYHQGTLQIVCATDMEGRWGS